MEKRDQGAKNFESSIINPLVDKKNENKLRDIISWIKTKYVQSTQLYYKLGGL